MLPTTESPSSEPSVLPVCPEHTEQPSVAACERCGRFLCQACRAWEQPPRCAPCSVRLADPLGILAQPFSITNALRHGWRLFVGACPGILGVAVIFSIPSGLLTYALESAGLSSNGRIYDATLGLMGVGASLALMVGVAEGRRYSVLQALGEGFRAWPRLFGARFRSGLWILLFGLLLVIPGIIKAVSLALATEAAFREPTRDALENSSALTQGRRWEVFGMVLLCYIPLLICAAMIGLLGTLLLEELPALSPLMTVLMDLAVRVGEAVTLGVGLAAFYGLKRSHEQPLTSPSLAPR
jgi:hypothetical protein